METLRDPAQFTDSGKRVLYFSDGTLEVDETAVEASAESGPVQEETVNLKELEWGPWAWQVTSKAAGKTLEVCDYLGESLASLFGITTPKYQFEINEYHRLKKAEEEEKKEKDLEIGTWVKNAAVNSTVISPPETVQVKSVDEIHNQII